MSSSAWEVRFSNSRQLPYFYNGSSGESVWERPEEVSKDEVASLPGAHYLQANLANGGGGGASSDSVRASHLLVKHKDSRRASSWKESTITRTPEEAEAILQEHAASLGSNPSPEQFAALAKVHSDCSSAAKGGDLGVFSRGQMQKPFEDATFGLAVGTMSNIIKTDSGHHLILRTG